MTATNQELIEDLTKRTHAHLNQAEQFRLLDLAQLNRQPAPQSWSILECLEHLNRYGHFYLPEIARQIQKGAKVQSSALFKSGWLGNYFAKSMLPKTPLNKMKTFKSMNPAGSSQLDHAVVEEFIRQQKECLDLLQQARHIDLTRTKTGISISKWIRLRLGDTLRVVIYHNERHLLQAKHASRAPARAKV